MIKSVLFTMKHTEGTTELSVRKPRQLEGVVISDRMAKTVVVAVTRIKEHPKYKKRFRIVKNYKAHDEEGTYRVGDEVRIEETRPLSRQKQWRVVKRVGTRHIKEANDDMGQGDGSLDMKEKDSHGVVPMF